MTRPTRSISPRWLDLYLGLILLAFVAVCLGPSLLGFRTFLSVNILSNYWPWFVNGSHSIGHQLCSGDTFDAVMPSVANSRAQLYAGHLPNWQGAVAGGSPLASTPNLGLLDPLSLPYFVLPLWLAPAFVKLLELIAAVGGTLLYARRIGLSRAAGLLGGFVFATSGFMVVWTNWPQTRVAALIPLLFWTVERLIQRGRAADVVLVAIAVAAIVFGGFPAVTGLAIYLAGGYLIVRAVVLHRAGIRAAWKTIGLAFGALVLGGALTAVQLLPFASQLAATNLEYRSGYSTSGLPFSSLITLAVPDAYGTCVGGERAFSSYPGIGNPVETIAYVGAGAAVLAVVGAACGFRRRASPRGARTYFVAALVVILLLGWGAAQFREVVQDVPIFANNFIGRIRAVLGFVVAVLVGAGFDALLHRGRPAPRDVDDRDGDRDGELTTERPDEVQVGSADRPPSLRSLRWRQWLWVGVVWLVASSLALLIAWRAHKGAISGNFARPFDRSLWLPAWLGLATLVLVVTATFGSRWLVRVAALVIPAIIMAQGALFFHTFLPGDRPSDFYPNTPAHQYLEKNLGSQRFVGSNLVLYPSTGLYYGLRSPTGHAFHQQSWRDLLVAVNPKAMLTPTFSDLTFKTPSAAGNSPILDRLGVEYVAFAPGIPSGIVAALPATTSTVPASGTSAQCTVAPGPVRGVTVRFATAATAAANQSISVQVTASDGKQTVVNRRLLGPAVAEKTPVTVDLAGESFVSGTPIKTSITVLGARYPVSLDGIGSSAACAAVTPQVQDHLRLVYADAGIALYQRLTALPRIRWAGSATVVVGSAAQVAALARGVPADHVVVGDAGVPSGSGQSAQLTVPTDRYGRVVTDVDASGDGYLVVADALQQPGWSARLDGHPVDLVDADHAMVAVHVPQGKHQVVLSYRPPGQRTGAGISVVAVGVVLSLVWWDLRRRRRTEPRGPARHSVGDSDMDASRGA